MKLFEHKIVFFFHTHHFEHVFWGARKNRLNETVLLSTHNIGLG